MAKQEAPKVQPEKPARAQKAPDSSKTPADTAEKPVTTRGRFIDFAPKRKSAPKISPAKPPVAKISIPDEEEIELSTPKAPESKFSRESAPEIPKAPDEPEDTPLEKPEKSPETPLKRARKPFKLKGAVIDFIRPKHAETAPEAVVEHISAEGQVEDPETGETATVSVERTTVRRSRHHLTAGDIIVARPKRRETLAPAYTDEEIDDFATARATNSSVKSARAAGTTRARAAFDDDLPPVDESDLAIALAGFVDGDDQGLSNPVPTDDLSREAADFADEIDALDELSSDDDGGNDIDKELEKALELDDDTDDFLKPPKPLFEDGDTPKTAGDALKAMKEQETAKTAAAERVSDQDFASGRGINYDPLVKDAERAEEIARKEAEKAEKARIAKAKAEAPDGNMYTLGGRSPFLTSVHVEKRPLSQYAPASNMTSLETLANTPVKNTYRAKMKKLLENDAAEIHRQTLIVSTPDDAGRSHSTALIIAIILTVLLGAGVGALVYLVFFQ